MKILPLLALCVPLGYAQLTAPRGRAPSNLRVVGASVLGTGCPRGTADVQVDPSKTLLRITFSDFVVQTGPGTQASDWRKNCKLTLNMQFDQGFS